MLTVKESYEKQLNWLYSQYENAVIDGDEQMADSLEIRIEIFKKVMGRMES